MTTVKATDEGLVYTVDECYLCPLNAEGYCRPLGAYWAHLIPAGSGTPPDGCPLRSGSILLNLHPLEKGFTVVPDSSPEGFVVREVSLVSNPDPGCEFIEPQPKPWTGGYLPWEKR